MSLIVTIKRPDGTTYDLEIPYQGGVEASINIFKRFISNDYHIIDWRFE